jgi:hypothetical protein
MRAAIFILAVLIACTCGCVKDLPMRYPISMGSAALAEMAEKDPDGYRRTAQRIQSRALIDDLLKDNPEYNTISDVIHDLSIICTESGGISNESGEARIEGHLRQEVFESFRRQLYDKIGDIIREECKKSQNKKEGDAANG